jgi:hypothetical protein
MHLRWEQIRGTCKPKRWNELQRIKEQLRPRISPLWLGFILHEELTGTVTRIMNDRFFVDLGEGLEGQVHITDMAW